MTTVSHTDRRALVSRDLTVKIPFPAIERPQKLISLIGNPLELPADGLKAEQIP